MKLITAVLLLALNFFSTNARADCISFNCAGVVKEIQVSESVAQFAIASANPQAVMVCDATGNGGLATFVLPATHPKYEELFSLLHVAAATPGKVVSVNFVFTPGSRCTLGTFISGFN